MWDTLVQTTLFFNGLLSYRTNTRTNKKPPAQEPNQRTPTWMGTNYEVGNDCVYPNWNGHAIAIKAVGGDNKNNETIGCRRFHANSKPLHVHPSLSAYTQFIV